MQPAALPEPEALFDSLLARKDFKEHPNKISSVLFYLASIIIHGRLTDLISAMRNGSITETNISQTCSRRILGTIQNL
jgi:hypothetical protein